MPDGIGNFIVDATDDAIHSNGNIIVSGGAFVLLTGTTAFMPIPQG